MSDSASSNIPWASLAVLAAFVSSTLLVPQAFEHMRPPEKERAQPALSSELEVDARLWEDPFMAWRRTESERRERCEKERQSGAKTIPKDCDEHQVHERRSPDSLLAAMRRTVEEVETGTAPEEARIDASVMSSGTAPGVVHKMSFSPPAPKAEAAMADHLVMAVMVPGNPFVGAEEARRRTRYAILSGLQAKHYLPVNAERMGLLEFRWDEQDRRRHGGAAKASHLAKAAPGGKESIDTFVAPYELLLPSSHARGSAEASYRSIAVLWINEAALPTPKLDAFAHVLHDVFEKAATPPRLAVIGPSGSDALQVALHDLAEAADEHRPVEEGARRGYVHLAHAEIFSPSATVPDRELTELTRWRNAQVPEAAKGSDDLPARRQRRSRDLERFLTEKLALLLPAGDKPTVHIERTIATDSLLLKSLVSELRLRLPPHSPRRIVLLAERDSLYSQALVSQFRARLAKANWQSREACGYENVMAGPSDREPPEVEVAYFYRGIDGVTMREGGDKVGEQTGTRRQGPIEWPEARDQLDYLRRIAGTLKDSETHAVYVDDSNGQKVRRQPAPIGAIGIFALDVHDKLLVLQALRDNFPDKVFFTTDMDARYLHPEVVGFTRNLVIASSLPTSFPNPKAQDGVPPFRDVYQSSAFVAARRAACRAADCKEQEAALFKPALDCPSVYEVGRTGPFAVQGYDLQARPTPATGLRAVVAALLIFVIAFALFVWPSTPAMVSARSFLLDEPSPLPGDQSGLKAGSAVIVAMHFALLVFIVGSVLEFVNQAGLGLAHIGQVAAWVSAAVCVGLLLLRIERKQAAEDATRAARWRARLGVDPRRRMALSGAAVVGVVSVAVWSLWPKPLSQPCQDCEPAAWIEGISAWPSHLLHIMAMFVILWALDDLWSHARRSRRLDKEWLAAGQIGSCGQALPAGPWARCRHWIESNTLLLWRRSDGLGVDFQDLWCQYEHRGRGRARLARVMFGWVATTVIVYLLFTGFSEGYVPEVPVRGLGHRRLIAGTFYALLALLPLLVFAVADAHMLACRFIWHLKGARSFYPEPTLRRFARELGDKQVDAWMAHVAADPAQRSDAPANDASPHTLLDDWIDMQVVERRTALVAPLIIGPFIVLALMVVARSRLLDAWAVTMPIALAVAGYCAWLIGLAALLRHAAQSARDVSLERMKADLRWLRGAGPARQQLVGPFSRLIQSVENNRSGAFASFFDQPLFKALLVPLGGAGGAQLFDQLLLAR
ncbi:hypothetical protein [Piscinibacter terrae]|uniref:hypothetical protein n=1 Tax=Piscinibacter terrae TaxID=2496871 RepID=UPI001387120C|nr:hypothetical protein [Albitalea terrae]